MAKAAKKKPAKKKPAKGLNRAAVNAKVRTARNARAQVLPGMENLRDTQMDIWAGAIAEIRRNRALGVEDEAGYSTMMHQHMIDRGYKTYIGAGLRIDRVKGKGEKLSIHLVKDRTEKAVEVNEKPKRQRKQKPLANVDNEPPMTTEELQSAADGTTTH